MASTILASHIWFICCSFGLHIWFVQASYLVHLSFIYGSLWFIMKISEVALLLAWTPYLSSRWCYTNQDDIAAWQL